MSLIQIVIAIVLTGLLMTIGIFYGGSAYSNSKPQINSTEIISELNQISDAVKVSYLKGVNIAPLGGEGAFAGCGDTLDQKSYFGVFTCDKKAAEEAFYKMVSNGILTEEPMFGKVNYFFGDSTYGDFRGIDFSYGDLIAIDIPDSKVCSEINKSVGGFPTGSIPSVNVENDGGGIIDFSASYNTFNLSAGVKGKSLYCAELRSPQLTEPLYRVYKISNMPVLMDLGLD